MPVPEVTSSIRHAVLQLRKSKLGYTAAFITVMLINNSEQVVAYALSRRPNVKLVDTDLPFGKEGFTSYMGKNFDASLKLTRRYYPHAYNVDGFFVAKFKKTGPTQAGPARGSAGRDASVGDIVDKSPILDDGAAVPRDEGEFGGFDEEEDQAYMEKAKRSSMRRRGLDPKSLDRPRAGQKKSSM